MNHDALADATLTFHALNDANVRRCASAFHPIDSWSPSDWATALAGEVGELCNEIKKLRRLDQADKALDTPDYREELRRKIGREAADVLTYLDLLCSRFHLDLAAETRKKFNEVSQKRGSEITL